MCPNKFNVKILTAFFLSLLVGLISGIVYPEFFVHINRILLAVLATSTIALIILSQYLLGHSTKCSQDNFSQKPYLTAILFSAVGGFVFSIISMTAQLVANALSAVLFGITIGFFTLLILSIILTLIYFINN